jgi:hypothetical protein
VQTPVAIAMELLLKMVLREASAEDVAAADDDEGQPSDDTAVLRRRS